MQPSLPHGYEQQIAAMPNRRILKPRGLIIAEEATP
jgi:hypothetical protein